MIESEGAVRLAALEGPKRVDKFDTRVVGDGIVAAAPFAGPDVRVLAHVGRWTSDLTTAVERSIGRLP